MTTENNDQNTNTPAPAPVTPPMPTPAPAPAPTPEPEKKPDAGKNEPTEVVPFEYAPVEGDPGLTMALQFVGKHGITPDSPEMQAAMNGDFSFIKAKMASLGAAAQGFEHYVAMAEKSYENHVKTETEKQTKTAGLLHEAVGGEEAWKEIQSWATSNAEPEEKEQINAMINAGGFQARAAAALLQQLYTRASGTVQEPASPVQNVPANNASPAQGAISPADYQKAISALVAKHGPIGASKSPEWAALQQRRANYRGQ